MKTFNCTICGYEMRTETIPAAGGSVTLPPYIPSNSTNTTAVSQNTASSKEPYISDENGKTGWEAISDEIIAASDGSTVTVQMNGTTELPKNIVSAIQDRDIDLVLIMNGGFVWTINGMSVTKAKTVDMRVRKISKIPESTIQEFFGVSKTVQLDLRHNGDFGFTAVLTIDIGDRYSGMYANSYCYKSKNFEFGDSSEIVNGQAKLRFAHASSWLITVDDYSLIEDVSSAAGIYENSEKAENSKIFMVMLCMTIVVASGIFYRKMRKKIR